MELKAIGLRNVPNTMTVTTGTLTSGTVTDVQEWADGNAVNITEVTGVPGYDVELEFEDIEIFTRIGISAYYTGTSSHYCEVDIYDYTNATWRTLFTFNSGIGFNYRFSDIPVSRQTILNDYINNGKAKIRFYHPVSGNVSHNLHIDYVSLTDK